MSSPEQVVKYVLTWNALSDACPKCRSLNGEEFEADRVYNEKVWSGQWGDVWDLQAGHSLAHPNCRCQLAVRVETRPSTINDMLERLLTALTTLRQKLERI